MPEAGPSTRLSAGERTRQSILKTAVNLASTDGLEGLSIGRLASEMGMSKSGLFAHFGSKEDLQLATVDEARARFTNAVFHPALKQPRGRPRLLAICQAWMRYAENDVFPGGCFFVAASAEFDGKPGRVRDRVAGSMREWLKSLEVAIIKAQQEKHLTPDVDPTQLAFEINALFMGANWAYQLHDDERAFARAMRGIEERIERATIKKSRKTASRPL